MTQHEIARAWLDAQPVGRGSAIPYLTPLEFQALMVHTNRQDPAKLKATFEVTQTEYLAAVQDALRKVQERLDARRK